MPASIIVAVRSALIEGLKLTDLADEPTEISYQYLAKSSKRERIFTTRARFTHQPASLRAGRNFRDEEGRFDVVVLVEGVGKSAEWAADRAMDLALVVEEFIADRKNNELDVTGLQTLVVEGEGTVTEMFNDAGHLAEVTIPVRFTARLQ